MFGVALLDAQKTILLAEFYMEKLGFEIDRLNRIKLHDDKVIEYINEPLPLTDNTTKTQENNIVEVKNEACNKIKELLAENEEGSICDCTVTWKSIQTDKSDTKRLKLNSRISLNIQANQATGDFTSRETLRKL